MTHGISYFGAMIVAMNVLRKSKDGKEGTESFGEKIARDGFAERASCVRRALNHCGGATMEAAQWLKMNWFTDVSDEQLVVWLTDAIGNLGKPVNAPKSAVGDLDFAAAAQPVAVGHDEEDEEEDYEEEDED